MDLIGVVFNYSDIIENPANYPNLLNLEGYKIYKITCVINNKCYIGDSNAIMHKRIWAHFNCSIWNERHYLYRSMRKYGLENFTFEILDNSKTEEEWIAFYDSCDNGYNGNYSGTYGKRMTFEDRSLLSRLSAKTRLANGTWPSQTISKERKSEAMKRGNKNKVTRGTHNFQNIPKEIRSNRMLKAANTKREHGTHNFANFTFESMSLMASKGKVTLGDSIIAYLEQNNIEINEHNINSHRHILKRNLRSVPMYQSYLKHLNVLSNIKQNK